MKRVGRRSAFTQSEGGTQNNTLVEAREGFLVGTVAEDELNCRVHSRIDFGFISLFQSCFELSFSL